MKLEWEVKRFEEITDDCLIGVTRNSSEQSSSKKYKYAKMNNITKDNCFDFSEYTCIDATHTEVEKYCLKNGDFLFNTRNSYELVGKSCVFQNSTDEMILFNNNILRVRFNENISSSFINYTFSHKLIKEKIDQIKNGTTNVSAVYYKDLKNLTLAVPSLGEQKRIVAILDEVFAAIAKAKENAEKNLQNAKELFESYLQSVFANPGDDWDMKTLDDVLQKTELVDPTKKPNEEFIYLDVSSVNKETKEIENATKLLGKDAPSRARKLIRTNDVIFATVRPTHRRVALITEEYNEQVCSTGYFVLRAKNFLDNKLIFYFLQNYGFYKQMEILQKGASYPAVTDSEMKGIAISFPKSLTEQKCIIEKLDALSVEIKELESIYKQKLNNLDELKKSILQKAFNGELNTIKEIESV